MKQPASGTRGGKGLAAVLDMRGRFQTPGRVTCELLGGPVMVSQNVKILVETVVQRGETNDVVPR